MARRTYEQINGARIEKRFDRVSEEVAVMLRKVRERVFPIQSDFMVWAGIRQQSISRWERPGHLPMLRTLLVVAEATKSRLRIAFEWGDDDPIEVIFDPQRIDLDEQVRLDRKIREIRQEHGLRLRDRTKP